MSIHCWKLRVQARAMWTQRPGGEMGRLGGRKGEETENNDAFHWIHCVQNSSSQIQLMCIYCCHCRATPFNRLSISGWCRLAGLDGRGLRAPRFQRTLGALCLSIWDEIVVEIFFHAIFINCLLFFAIIASFVIRVVLPSSYLILCSYFTFLDLLIHWVENMFLWMYPASLYFSSSILFWEVILMRLVFKKSLEYSGISSTVNLVSHVWHTVGDDPLQKVIFEFPYRWHT